MKIQTTKGESVMIEAKTSPTRPVAQMKNINARICNTRQAFAILKPVWKSIKFNNKVILHKSLPFVQLPEMLRYPWQHP